MKNKKGFTLIELLAVIVILAIIALIATPAIINVIENARKKAFEDTSYGVLESLRLDYIERVAAGTSGEEKTFTFPNSGLKLSGEEPEYGEAKIDSKGNISFALADKDKKWCTKKESTSEKVIVEEYNEETCKIDGIENILDGTVVFYDPIAGTTCNTYVETNSLNETKTGCMKFYTFGGNNNSDTVNLILDHNTSYKAVWNSGVDNTNNEVFVKLENDTFGWKGNPRLITVDELVSITGNNNFDNSLSVNDTWFYFDSNNQTQTVNSTNKSKYNWLYNYTKDCINGGCSVEDENTYGYWTNSKVTDSSLIWVVFNDSSVSGGLVDNILSGPGLGIRPVITISKFLIS